MESKKTIRKKILEKRDQLPDSYYKEASEKIHQNLFSLDEYKSAQTIFVYYSMKKELNTIPIIEKALEENKRVTIPRTVGPGQMNLVEYKIGDPLEEVSFGALEPLSSAPVVSPKEVDLIIMPCVTCNNKGERLGYGGGFYDRLLDELSTTTVLPYFSKLQTQEIPMEAHDKKVDYVITEDSIVKVIK